MLRATLAALAGALVPACGGSSEPPPPRPNVLVVVVDTLRADRLPFLGRAVQNAPFLSGLAQRGVVFERAWSTSSWTMPAMASLFTSLYPDQFLGDARGIELPSEVLAQEHPEFRISRIPSRLEILPEAMARLGYRTFGVADNPNLCGPLGFRSGFGRFATFSNRGADAVNAQLAEWSQEIAGAEPWFVYLHYMDPHFPYERHEPWFEPPPGPEPDFATAPVDELRPWVDATYDSEVRFTDEHIREAFDLVGADGDTVVLFTADHGESLLQRGHKMQHGFELFSELTHVPLLVVHPGVEPVRRRVSGNVSLVDVLPTLLDVLGSPPSEQAVGRSLVPYYTQPEEPPDDRAVFSMRSRLDGLGGGRLISVVRGDEKLISGELPGLPRPADAYFDIGRDWGELRDRASDEPQRVAALRALWDEFWGGARTYEPEVVTLRLTMEQARRLEDLGYVEGHGEGSPPRRTGAEAGAGAAGDGGE